MSQQELKNFIPLKLYSNGSILYSVNTIDSIVKFLKQNNFTAGALVDLHNVFLAVDFYKKMKKAGMKPIIGCGFTINQAKAITIICKNKDGWKNLLNLIYTSYKNNNDSPFLKLEDLKNVNGLCCLVGSPYSFSSIEEHEYIDLTLNLQKVFKSNLYIERHPNFFYISDLLHSLLDNSKILACTDCFYIQNEEKLLNNILIANSLKKKIEDIQDHFLVKNNFKYCDISNLEPEYLQNTIDLANEIEDLNLLSDPMLPEFGVDKPIKELRNICLNRLKELNLSDNYLHRLEHELNVIDEAGFASYFLIVSDMIRFARSKNMMIGECRGCLSSSVDIFLANGSIKKINKVLIGDRVIGSDGLPHTVTNCFMYNNHDNMYNIVTYYGNKEGVTTTPDHKILTLEGWKEAQHITKKDYIFTPKIKLEHNKVCTNPYLFGLFTGDGWVRENRKNEVNIIYNTRNIYSLIKTCIDLSKSNIRYSIYFRKAENTYTLNILSKPVYDTILENFEDYCKVRRSEHKHIPQGILHCQEDQIKEFLVGYADSDGHKISEDRQSYCTKSKRLAAEVKFLHNILNIPCYIGKTANRIEYKVESSKKPKYAIITDTGMYLKVKNIKISDPELYVYDIEVSDCHNYLTMGGIVHNSVGGALTAYLSQITNIDPLKHDLIFERFYNSSRNYEEHISFEELDYVEYKNSNI